MPRIVLKELETDRSLAVAESEALIGRDPACAVCLNDASVSRRHARIRISADARAALLDDLESTNGTYIGRRRVEEEPMRLVDGNVIKVGSVELTFREAADALAPTRRVRRSTRDRAGR